MRSLAEQNGRHLSSVADAVIKAAITRAVNGTLVTRNTVDFQRIPGLVLPPDEAR